MFDTVKDAFDDFNDSIDDTGILKKTASLTTGRRVIDSDNLEEEFEKLELSLISADVEREVAGHIVSETKKKVDGQKVGIRKSPSDYVQNSLREVLKDIFAMNQMNIHDKIQNEEKPITILFAGINGVGKTTTIAKLAYQFEKQGYDCVIANGDTFRAGAREQVKQHAESVDVPVISHERGGDPAAVIYDAIEFANGNDKDIVLGDTAGRLNNDDSLMGQLGKISRITNPDYTIFVEQATAGQDAVKRARDFKQKMDSEDKSLDGVIVTKVDATNTGGAVLSIPFAVSLPVLFVTTGENYDDIESIDPEQFAERII